MTVALCHAQGNALEKVGKAVVILNLDPYSLDVNISEGGEIVLGQRLVESVVCVGADKRFALRKAGDYKGVVKISALVCKLDHVALYHARAFDLDAEGTDAAVLRGEGRVSN